MLAGAVFFLGGVLWLGFDLYPVTVGIGFSVLGGIALLAGALRS
jgi:hypothetical protein